MSDYTAEFQPFYENGWENQPSENTPIMGEALDSYDNAIVRIESFLVDLDTSGGGGVSGDYALLSEAGYSISGSVASNTGFLTLNLLNKAGETLSTKTFYFPFGQMFNGVTIADGLIQFKTYAGAYHKLDISPLLEDLETDIANVESIAKGKNRARVFSTTEDMNAWLSDANNIGVAMKGDNLYIVELDVPDWWISEVLEEPNASGMYYEIAQLETQKVDLSNYISQNDVVDDLTSTETQKPLSANQGMILSTEIEELDTNLENTKKQVGPFKNISIGTSGGFGTMESDIASQWNGFENGAGFISVNNGTTLFHGTYYKYSDTIGSITFHDAVSNDVYVWSLNNGVVSLDTLALRSEANPIKTITATSASNGNVLVSNSANGETPLSVVCDTDGYYVGRLFKNQYGLWYATIFDVATIQAVTSETEVTLYAIMKS